MRLKKFPGWLFALLIATIVLFAGTQVMAADPCVQPDPTCFTTTGGIQYQVNIVRGSQNEFPDVTNSSGNPRFKYKLRKILPTAQAAYVNMLIPAAFIGELAQNLTSPNIKTYVNGNPSAYQLFKTGGDPTTNWGSGEAPNYYTLKLLGFTFIAEPEIWVEILNKPVGTAKNSMMIKTSTADTTGSILQPAALPAVFQTGASSDFEVFKEPDLYYCRATLRLDGNGSLLGADIMNQPSTTTTDPAKCYPTSGCVTPPGGGCFIPAVDITQTWLCDKQGTVYSNCQKVTNLGGSDGVWMQGGFTSCYSNLLSGSGLRFCY